MVTSVQPRVYLFWDNSNIFISAQTAAERKESLMMRGDARIHFENLYHLAVAGRPVGKAVAVGSVPPEQRALWDRLKSATGIDIELCERGRGSGTEQGLDQCLQTHMLRALADEELPQIVVLLTGDGKGYEDGIGFHADLERMQKRGWGIEVLAWDATCNRNLKTWAMSVGRFVALEDFYHSVTFLDGTRTATPLNLTHRGKAVPQLQAADKDRVRIQTLEAANKELQKKLNTQGYNEKIKRRNASKSKKGR